MDEEIPYNELLVDVEDSIVVGLYHYLWLKDGKGRSCPEVNVPHTVIISNGRPKVWYFTSGKEHCIKRKNRANLNNTAITEALAPKPKPGETSSGSVEPSSSGGLVGGWGVATPIQPSPPQRAQHRRKTGSSPEDVGNKASGGAGAGGAAAAAAAPNGRVLDGNSNGNALGPWPHHGVVARFQGSMTNPQLAVTGPHANKGASLGRRKKGAQFELQEESVEFFSREQLMELLPPGHAVLHGVAALHEGVLQRFVQPRGQHHFSIRATWSPNACVVERRTCKAKLNDPRVPLADRLAGWDGPNWLSEHTLITGTVLHGSICRVCDNVASHLADVSSGAVRVLRMVLFFMVDDANRIWLTYCGTLKTQRHPGMAITVPLAPGNSGQVAMQMAARLRPGSTAPLPLPPASAALRLRAPESPRKPLLSADPGFDLPAPSPSFVAAAAAAARDADGGDGGGDGDSPGTSGRFLCVLTGEMYPGSQRCDVTYKQLLQHWFSLASQLPNEGDRLRAMDTIPLAIRRANPSLTREWYLRVRSQPTFLYRTAPVCAEAAGQITGVALDELQRNVRPLTPGNGIGLGGSGALGPMGVSMSGGGRGSNGGDALLGGLRRQGGRPAAPAATAADERGQRTRPVTAAASAHPQLPPGTPGQHQPAARQASRQVPRGLVTRSKSASPSMGGSRLLPSSSGGHGAGATGGLGEPSALSGGGGGSHGASRFSTLPPPGASSGGGGGGLPSMLVPRDRASGVPGGSAWPPLPTSQSSLLQVYGPTAEQAADAAAAAAALPYEVLGEATQLAGDVSADGGEDEHEEGQGAAQVSLSGGVQEATGPGSPQAAAAVAAAVAAGASITVGSTGGKAHPGPGGGAASGAAWPPSAGAGAGGYTGGAGASSNGMWGGRPTTRRSNMRMSTSSEATEMGSIASNSEPNSPNGTHTGLHPVYTTVGSSSARMSPPRTAGVPTLHTIHEEGAAVVPPARRPKSPLGGAELVFPPPRGSGSHSVPRMRPPTRVGADKPPGMSSRRYGGGGGSPYSRQSNGGGNRGYSDTGELPQLQPGAGGNSLNSTMASSIGSASRRSTNTNTQQGMLSNDDMRTLRELSEAYTAAERLTQQLLAQAHDILSEDGGSRPGSTGNSPMHGGRRQVSPPGLSGTGGSRSTTRPDSGASPTAAPSPGVGLSLARQPSLTTGAGAGGSAAAGGPAGAGGGLAGVGGGGSRPNNGSGRPPTVPQLPVQRPPSGGSGRGPSPLGLSQGSRQGSGRPGSASGSGSLGGADGGPISERSLQNAVQLLPPVLSRTQSGTCSAQLATGETGGGDGTGSVDMGLLTSAEADLLAEALQE